MMNQFVKTHSKLILICATAIICTLIYCLVPRYYVHTAYKHTTIIDRWTGRVVSH